MPSKKCSTCQTTKPLTAFGKNKADKTGIHSVCRICCKISYLKSRNRSDLEIMTKTDTKKCSQCERFKEHSAFKGDKCFPCIAAPKPGTKRCSKCTEIKQLSKFSKSKNKLNSWCKLCVNADSKSKYKAKTKTNALPGHKCCTKCKDTKLLSEFNKGRCKDGKQTQCKACRSRYKKAKRNPTNRKRGRPRKATVETKPKLRLVIDKGLKIKIRKGRKYTKTLPTSYQIQKPTKPIGEMVFSEESRKKAIELWLAGG